jgi:Flp pilus assembly protein TadD
MQNPPRLDRLTEPIRVADSPISGKCSLHFPDIGGASPEELLWRKPEQRFRPFGRIFHKKCRLLGWITFLLLAPLQADDNTMMPMLTPEARSTIEQGLSEFRDNKFEDAEKTFQKVTDMVPNHPMGWINLGSVQYRLGKLDDAERSLRKAVHLDPEVAQAWLTLGIVAYNKEEPEAALAALSQAVFFDSASARAHMYLGVCMRKRGWLDAAEDELRKAVELDPNYSEAQFNLAIIYSERTPPALELARRHYYRALALGAAADPDLEKLLKPSPEKK